MFCFTTSKSQTIHSSIQEQACYAGRLPSPSHPIGTASRKQYRRIHRPIKKSHMYLKISISSETTARYKIEFGDDASGTFNTIKAESDEKGVFYIDLHQASHQFPALMMQMCSRLLT